MVTGFVKFNKLCYVKRDLKALTVFLSVNGM
jgi:hypothetical protein